MKGIRRKPGAFLCDGGEQPGVHSFIKRPPRRCDSVSVFKIHSAGLFLTFSVGQLLSTGAIRGAVDSPWGSNPHLRLPYKGIRYFMTHARTWNPGARLDRRTA